jgi:hypothetical protein
LYGRQPSFLVGMYR